MNASRASRYGRGRGTGTGKSTSAKDDSASRICALVHPAFCSTSSISARGIPFASAIFTNSVRSSGVVDIEVEPSRDGGMPIGRFVQRVERTRLGGDCGQRLYRRLVPSDVPPCAELVADVTIHAHQFESHCFVQPDARRIRQRDTGSRPVIAQKAEQSKSVV